MKNNMIVSILFGILIVAISPATTSVPSIEEVRSGVFVSNEISDLPFPISNYDIYTVGEGEHGVCEIHDLFMEYLKILNEERGLRHIVLEGPQFDERRANKYVLGLSDKKPYTYSYFADIFEELRIVNESLSDNKKICVHLVDIDFQIQHVYYHINDVKKEMGSQADHIRIPPLDEFEGMCEDSMLALVDELAGVGASSDQLASELETIRVSIQYSFTDKGNVWREAREERIAKNIQELLKELSGAPIMALFGKWHAQKCQETHFWPYGKPWVQQLIESGTSIYSLYVTFVSGDICDFSDGTLFVYNDPEQLQFSDDSTLATILEEKSNYTIFYVDLRLESNYFMKLNNNHMNLSAFKDTPAGEIYDGIIVFRDVTPLWSCELLQEASFLFEKGKESFEEENYEAALEYFQQAQEKYANIGSERVEQCEEWIKKTRKELGGGICLGTIILMVIMAERFYSKIAYE
jgi:hypothetical protein